MSSTKVVAGIAGFALLLALSSAAIIVGSVIKARQQEQVSAQFWELLKADRDTAIASIDHIIVEYWLPRPAAESTMFFGPDPESFRMDDPEDIARIFPVGPSPGDHFGSFGSIRLNIRTKAGTSPTIVMYNHSDLGGWPWISPAFNPDAGTWLREDAAAATLEWIANRRQNGLP